MYTEPNEDKPCYKCRFKEYLSFHDESYCGHKPLPDFLGGWTPINTWGSCEYWEQDIILYKE